MEDSEAIHRLKNDDISGLASLVNKYQVKAVRTAFLVTHDETLSEDIVQDVFIRLYRRIHHFTVDRAFEPYLMRSVVNAALNAIRREWRLISLDAHPSLLESLLEEAASVETQVEFSQLTEEILEALSELPLKQRAVVVQRYYLEMSEREMAQSLGAPPGTIKWLLHTARKRLSDILRSERSLE